MSFSRHAVKRPCVSFILIFPRIHGQEACIPQPVLSAAAVTMPGATEGHGSKVGTICAEGVTVYTSWYRWHTQIAAGAPLTHQGHTESKPRNDREGFLLMIHQLVRS